MCEDIVEIVTISLEILSMTTGQVGCTFPPGTLVARHVGVHSEEELWLMIDPDHQQLDGWNYWVVMSWATSGQWEISRVVPHWGRYEAVEVASRIGDTA